MKFLLLLIIFFTANLQNHKTIYLCDNGKTKKYHLSKQCRGLRNCSYKILKMNLDKAQKTGYSLCGWED